MQLSLFVEDPEHQGCRYPQVSGLSGYRYGCRCPRCAEARARWQHPTSQCYIDDCTAPRLKHRRWCVEHAPPPATRPKAVRSEAPCELCGRLHSWYESTFEHNIRPEVRDLYRRTCNDCRKGYIAAIKSHRLTAVDGMRLIIATECELCGERFPTDNRGRRHSVVDHDHGCCSGANSCGQCVRGIICHRCNVVLGALEHVERTMGIDKFAAYLSQHRR